MAGVTCINAQSILTDFETSYDFMVYDSQNGTIGTAEACSGTSFFLKDMKDNSQSFVVFRLTDGSMQWCSDRTLTITGNTTSVFSGQSTSVEVSVDGDSWTTLVNLTLSNCTTQQYVITSLTEGSNVLHVRVAYNTTTTYANTDYWSNEYKVEINSISLSAENCDNRPPSIGTICSDQTTKCGNITVFVQITDDDPANMNTSLDYTYPNSTQGGVPGSLVNGFYQFTIPGYAGCKQDEYITFDVVAEDNDNNITLVSDQVPTLDYHFNVGYDFANEVEDFTPIPGKKYILSAWVKESTIVATGYTKSSILVNFDVAGSFTFTPVGRVIDGWQRIEGEFTIPAGAADISLTLQNISSTSDSYFDDIRIFPFNGNMKSYVYDPITFKFTAELDNNNYATFYEYDEEGNLTRVKKETARGILTIKESRNNTKK